MAYIIGLLLRNSSIYVEYILYVTHQNWLTKCYIIGI